LAAQGLSILSNGSVYNNNTGTIIPGIVLPVNANFAANLAVNG
jgi:hypothetical protein